MSSVRKTAPPGSYASSFNSCFRPGNTDHSRKARKEVSMKCFRQLSVISVSLALVVLASVPPLAVIAKEPAKQPAIAKQPGVAKEAARAKQPARAQQKQPNILVIMGDDVGWFNIGAYHRGMMSGKTPNLDKLASQGMMFTDYYAEASCTAGRANFITGELPIRTGLTTVGQAGADVGIPDEAVTLATVLKSLGYATGQFGKNHLGDLNKYLPTVHGFDEFFGYLYHLDAMSDPYWYSFPVDQNFYNQYGPRSLVHCYATETD